MFGRVYGQPDNCPADRTVSSGQMFLSMRRTCSVVCTDSPDMSARPKALACVKVIRRMRGSIDLPGPRTSPRHRLGDGAARLRVSCPRGFLFDGVYNHQTEISERTCPMKTVRRTVFIGQSAAGFLFDGCTHHQTETRADTIRGDVHGPGRSMLPRMRRITLTHARAFGRADMSGKSYRRPNMSDGQASSGHVS